MFQLLNWTVYAISLTVFIPSYFMAELLVYYWIDKGPKQFKCRATWCALALSSLVQLLSFPLIVYQLTMFRDVQGEWTDIVQIIIASRMTLILCELPRLKHHRFIMIHHGFCFIVLLTLMGVHFGPFLPLWYLALSLTDVLGNLIYLFDLDVFWLLAHTVQYSVIRLGGSLAITIYCIIQGIYEPYMLRMSISAGVLILGYFGLMVYHLFDLIKRYRRKVVDSELTLIEQDAFQV